MLACLPACLPGALSNKNNAAVSNEQTRRTDALDVILSLLGATCSMVVSYILPGLAYAAKAEPGWKRSGANACWIVGSILSPICIVATFLPTST